MGNKPQGRVSRLELQYRIETVVALIAEGKQRTAIQERLMDEWDVSLVTARLYVRKALDHITRVMGQEKVKQLAKAVLRLEYIYSSSVAQGDLKTALSAQNSLSKLLSLDRVATTGSGGEVDHERIEAEYELTDTA